MRDSQVDGASMTFIRSVWVGNDSDAHFVLPHLVCLNQQIQDCDELLHACHDCHLGRFAFRFQMRVECFDRWVVTDRNDRRHVQHAADLAASTTDETLARFLARVTVDRRDTDEFGIEPNPFGEVADASSKRVSEGYTANPSLTRRVMKKQSAFSSFDATRFNAACCDEIEHWRE